MEGIVTIIKRALDTAESRVPGLVWTCETDTPMEESIVRFHLNKLSFPFTLLFTSHVPHMLTLRGLEKRTRTLTEDQPGLVITKALTNEMFERFVQAGMSVIDTRGNVFLNHKAVYVQVAAHKKTGKAGQSQARITPLPDMWGPASLRLIYGILTEPRILNLPVRQLATQYDTAIGTVSHTLQRLRKEGIVSRKAGNQVFHRQSELARQWLAAYAKVLRPVLLIGRYRSALNRFKPDWKKFELAKSNGTWGGQPAADLLTHNLVPADFLLYTNKKNLPILLRELKLVPDESGDIELHHRFWPTASWEERYPEIAHPLLVYAELLNQGEQRLLNIAGEIYDQYLDDLIK